jgi:hypothetical protein
MATFRFSVTVDGETFTNEKGLDYKATAGKKGTATQPKPPKS